MKQRWIMMTGDLHLRCVPPEPARQTLESARQPVRTVLVTGGAGYIGAALVRGLLADGLRVRVLDSLFHGDAGIRALYTNPDFELIHGDIRHTEPVVRAVHGVDAVIHLASVVGPRACRRDPAAAIAINVAATSLLTEVCRGLEVTRLVLASTLDVYGGREREVDEGSEPDPPGLFAATQWDAERLALAAGDAKLHTTVFRLAEVFGADVHANFDRGLNRMAGAAWRSGRVAARSGGRPIYCAHVSDVCVVMRQALVSRAEVIAGEIFNVGCEQMRFTKSDIGALLAEAAPDLQLSIGKTMPDRPAPTVSFQKLRSRLGVACRGSMRQGLAELLLHLRRAGTPARRRDVAPTVQLPAAELAAARFLR